MYARVTSVIMQALESSLKKFKASIPPQDICFPVFSKGAKEFCLSLFQERCRKEIYHQVQVFTSSVRSDGM
jgi:2-hydroxy-3-keto-5-methylthiopentenyl-1-phosphate phosphatase